MTWLESHISQIGSVFERAFGPQPDGVRSGFLSTTGTIVPLIPENVGPEAGQRFEVDLLPYVHPGLMGLSSCLQLKPDLAERLMVRDLDAVAERRIDEHFSKKGFTYVDFSSGCFPVGTDYEVRGVFIRSGSLQARNGVVAPAFSRTHRCFDALFGRPGELTRQRLSWRLPGLVVTQASVPTDPDYPGETKKPADMLREAGMSLQDVLVDLTCLALKSVDYALENGGTSRVETVPRIPTGDPRAHRHAYGPTQSILSLAQLH